MVSGNGFILKELQQMDVDAFGMDINTGLMFTHEYPDIIYYDGYNIPFEDGCIDVIYSSNCLEHIVDLDRYELELYRVLKPGGLAFHVMPNYGWRFWSTVVHYFALSSRALKRFHDSDILMQSDQVA